MAQGWRDWAGGLFLIESVIRAIQEELQRAIRIYRPSSPSQCACIHPPFATSPTSSITMSTTTDLTPPRYHYDPSLVAAATFAGLFGVSGFIHLYQLAKGRTWYFIPFVIGVFCALHPIHLFIILSNNSSQSKFLGTLLDPSMHTKPQTGKRVHLSPKLSSCS